MIPQTQDQLQRQYRTELIRQGYTVEHSRKEAQRMYPTAAQQRMAHARAVRASKLAHSPASVTSAVVVENSAGQLTTSREPSPNGSPVKGTRTYSPEARRRISEASKAMWARRRAASKAALEENGVTA